MSISFYTVDVGHGLCQVIRFGDRAILVDGGGKIGKRIAEDFLKRYIRVIIAYIATHNDSDHVGAAPELLDYYSSASTLNSIWLLLDRPAKEPTDRAEDVIPLLGYSKRREEAGTIKKRYPLYVYDHVDQATLIHRESAENAELQLIFPKLFDTADAAIRGESDPDATNQASAILRLVVDGDTKRAAVLLTGDANCKSFQIAHDVYKLDLNSRVLAVPHHGGEIPSPSGSPSWDTVVGWVAPEIAVVSAGYGTVPRTTTTQRDTFDALRNVGSTICCTQITKHCHPQFGTLFPSVLPISDNALPQMSGERDFPNAVGCAGTITIKVLPTGQVELANRQAHQTAIDQKVVGSLGCPHCR